MVKVICNTCGAAVRSLAYPSREADNARHQALWECPICETLARVTFIQLQEGRPPEVLSAFPEVT